MKRWLWLLLLLGCDDAGDAPALEPGRDAAIDAAVDGAADGALDAAVDGQLEPDATPDAAPVVAPDATPDAAPDAGCIEDDDFFADQIVPILVDCRNCHRVGGLAARSRLRFEADDDAANAQRLRSFVLDTPDGDLLVLKPTNQVDHGGGQRFPAGSDRAIAMARFVARTRSPQDCTPPEPPVERCAERSPGSTPVRRLTDAQYRNHVAEIFGVDVPPGLLPETTRAAEFSTWVVSNTTSAAGAEAMLHAAEYVAEHASVDALLGVDPVEVAIERLAERAYRRPLQPVERVALVGLPGTGARKLRLAVQVILMSPQFLYLAVDATPEGDVARLDDHAVAARLAAFLRNGPPDAALREAAARGALRTRAQVAAHARRLLTAPAALDALTAFHRDWLNVWQLDNATRDPERYPDFSPAVVESMLTELDLFVTEVVWGGDGRFDSLLLSEATWLDSALASIYGLPDPGPGWHRAGDLGAERPGVMTRAAFLTAHGYAGSSSPVRRGAFVLQELLCERLTPPADVDMEIPEPSDDARTIRERLQRHWTAPACRACHERIDPVGFAFEHYGAVGEWRDTWDDGAPVDARGALPDVGAFADATELVELLSASDRLRDCYARRWFEYAVGRPAEAADQCALAQVQARFAASEGDLRNLLVDVTLTDAFRYRRPEVDE